MEKNTLLTNQLDSAESRTADLSFQIAELTGQLTKKTSHAESLGAQIQTSNEDMATLDARLTELTNDNEELKLEIGRLTNESGEKTKLEAKLQQIG